MNTSEYIFKGYQAGAVDYMIKPLSAEILKAKVIVFAELYRKNHELLIKEAELKQLNEVVMKANRELAEQNEEIEKQANELRNANKELEAFTYVSSHDLQEPLRKIQTFIAILLETEEQNLSEQGKHNFQRVRLAAERMRQLIESLLAFSHTNTTERTFEDTDLNAILEDVKNELKDRIESKSAVIEASDLGFVKIIPFQFTQLMQNLISNALKFSKPDVPSRIVIKCNMIKGTELKMAKLSPDKSYCHISFKDNGIGFAPHFSERIFEVFQRLHNRDAYEGTGIGLSIVKKIVENHNGVITANGEVMKGATFDIYIPN
jgi:light-regulated signal transduction histidine kinase (bacteriophytochrome)